MASVLYCCRPEMRQDGILVGTRSAHTVVARMQNDGEEKPPDKTHASQSHP